MLDAARFTVPYPEHTHFVGREEDLRRLHAALQGEGPVGINPAAMCNPTGVTGQGGIGKTQLAVAYAYRYQEHYPDGVYWLNAAEGLRSAFAGLGRHFLERGDSQALKARLWETLRSRFSIEEIRDLCLELGVTYEEFSPQSGISSLARELIAYCERRGQLALLEAAVRRLRGELAEPQAQDELVIYAFTWLRDHPRSLLILDNIADPTTLDKPLTRDCVPGHLPSHVLFTTRRHELGRFQPVGLKTLPPDAALKLLLRDPRRQPALDLGHPEHATARDICAVFGYLPLALEIAAAHLEKRPAALLVAYRDELRRRGALDVIADQRVPVETRHETGLAAALSAQWATLGKEVQMLLRVAGQLPEAAYIPAARLGLLAGVPEEGQSFFDVTLSLALDELQDASLIEELAGDQLRLHPLVREFARDRTPLAEKTAFREACVRRLLASISDIKTLERQVDARGIDAIIRDLLAARELLNGTGQEDVVHDLGMFLRVLRREAHNLRGWRRVDAPAFLAQQLHNRLVYSSLEQSFGDLRAHVQGKGVAFIARWAARSESSALETTLVGHTGKVECIALTPDGRHVVSGSSDTTLKIWNLDTGQLETTLTGHEGTVSAVAVTPDGLLVSGSNDCTLKIWEPATGRLLANLGSHGDWVQAIAVTSDGEKVISGGGDGTIKIWDLVTKHLEETLHAGDWVKTVSVTPNGRQLLSGAGPWLYVWDLETRQLKHKLLAGDIGSVGALATTADGRVIAGADDGLVTIWDLNTGCKEKRLDSQGDGVWALAVSSDGQRVVLGKGLKLKVYELQSGRLLATLTGHENFVRAVAITQDGNRIVSSSDDGSLRIWNLDNEQLEAKQQGHGDSVRDLAITPDGHYVVSAGGDHNLKIWEVDSGRLRATLSGHSDWVQAVVVTPDGQWVISGSSDHTVKVWSLNKGTLALTIENPKGAIRALAVTPSERLMILAEPNTIRIWNLKTNKLETTLSNEIEWYRCIAITPDGQRVILGGSTIDAIAVSSLIETNQLAISRFHNDAPYTLDIVATPDGRRLVAGSSDSSLKVWNLVTEQLERTLLGHQGEACAVAVTIDGRKLLSGSYDKTVRAWEFESGLELTRVTLDATVSCLAIVPTEPPIIIAGDGAGNVTCLELMK